LRRRGERHGRGERREGQQRQSEQQRPQATATTNGAVASRLGAAVGGAAIFGWFSGRASVAAADGAFLMTGKT